MVTWILFREFASEWAKSSYGRRYTWIPIYKTKVTPPRDEYAFQPWVQEKARFFTNQHVRMGRAPTDKFRLMRTHAKGESRGYKSVLYFALNHGKVVPLRRPPTMIGRRPQYGVPGARWWEDFYWRRPKIVTFRHIRWGRYKSTNI